MTEQENTGKTDEVEPKEVVPTKEKPIELQKQELCLNCQRCCRQVNILTAYSGDSEEMKRFYATRGFKVFIVAVSKDPKDTRILLTTDMACPFITPKGCAIYESRPKVCRDYDGRQDQFVDCAWKELKDA